MGALLLVRHGESTWNAEERLQGQADPPLSERGRAQACELAPLIASLAPDAAVSSDLARASDTCALLGYPEAPRDARWREIHMGVWQGRRAADVLATDEAAYVAWRAGECGAEGGESLQQLTARVRAVAGEQLAAPGVRLVVTHGGAIRAALLALLGIERGRLAAVGNCTLTVVEPAPDGGLRLAAYNVGVNGALRIQRGV